jgi:hypothetical protein
MSYSLHSIGASSAPLLHFYAGAAGWNRRFPGSVLDPGHNIAEPRIASLLQRLLAAAFEVGLHASVGTLRSSNRLRAECHRLESVAGRPVTAVRQHWLRYSWRDTWAGQARAGLSTDHSLGFIDRPGFRNGAALAFRPLVASGNGSASFTAVPLVLMDSHVYDYNVDARIDRGSEIERWIGEILAVRGLASVLWHPHTLRSAYGWRGRRGSSRNLGCTIRQPPRCRVRRHRRSGSHEVVRPAIQL